MILNGTKHQIDIYSLNDLVADRNGHCFLPRSKSVLPKKSIQPSFFRPLSVRKNEYIDTIIAENSGIGFKSPLNQVSNIDPIPRNVQIDKDIIIVSEFYANIAKQILPVELVDILFTITDIVKNTDGTIIGCANIRKVSSHYLPPSYYTNPRSNKICRLLAYNFWSNNKAYLTMYELDCLQVLKTCIDQDVFNEEN